MVSKMICDVFIQRPRLAVVISLVIILAGILCIFQMPVAEYPEIAPPQIMVRASYPGASAQVIADTIASVLEKQMNGVEDMIYYSSNSSNSGSYDLTISFEPGTNTDIALVNVQNAVSRAEPSLPSDVVALGVNTFKRSGDILGLFVFNSTAKNLSKLQMSNYLRMNVVDPLSRVPGVSDVMIFGELEYSMRIWLDPMKMSALGVRPEEIADAIRSQNVQAAAGSVGAEESNEFMQFKINTQGRLQSAEDFGAIVIKSGAAGRQLRIRDIARVELGASEYGGESYLNGTPAIAMAIYRSNDANANAVIKNINDKMAELSQYFPQGMNYKLTYDPTNYIRATMEEIIVTLVLTLIFVVAITYFFLQDWRATLIPTLAIPVSVVGTFAVLLALGFSINVLTMFALILVIGSVVDDAIIVVENCMRLIEEEGLPPREAASKCMDQVAGPIIATTLVVLSIYAPLSFYGGMVGTIYRQFSVTMCVALVISGIVAFTLSPAMCAVMLRKPKPNILFKPFNLALDGSRWAFLGLVRIFTRYAFLPVIVIGGVLYLNYYVFNHTPSSFLPDEDKGAIFCDVQLTPGATLGRTKQVMLEADASIRQVPGVSDVMAISGFSMLSGSGENCGMVIVVLDDWSKRKTPELSLGTILGKVRAKVSDIAAAQINCFAPPAIMGLGVTGGVSLELQATEGQTPQEIAQALRGFLYEANQLPGAAVAFSSYDANTPQLYLDLDRAKCEALQVPVSRVFNTLQSKLASLYVNDFNLYGYSFKVKIQADAPYRSTVRDIEAINVQSNTGKMVPLSAVATVRQIVGPRTIKRFTQFASADVRAQGVPGVSSGELIKQVEAMAKEKLPSGYRVAWTDMSFQEKANEGKIVFLMGLAMVFAYLFLVAQYESWTIPSSVMLSVTIATLGAMLGLHIAGFSMSIYAQLGLVMLIGLASKNAILMVEFSKQEREQFGKSVYEAAVAGAGTRYRAVLMTAWSFVLGVLPMVFATGAGAGSRREIGVTTFYGMLLATAVGIVFIPGLYAAFQHVREFGYRLIGRRLSYDKPDDNHPGR